MELFEFIHHLKVIEKAEHYFESYFLLNLPYWPFFGAVHVFVLAVALRPWLGTRTPLASFVLLTLGFLFVGLTRDALFYLKTTPNAFFSSGGYSLAYLGMAWYLAYAFPFDLPFLLYTRVPPLAWLCNIVVEKYHLHFNVCGAVAVCHGLGFSPVGAFSLAFLTGNGTFLYKVILSVVLGETELLRRTIDGYANFKHVALYALAYTAVFYWDMPYVAPLTLKAAVVIYDVFYAAMVVAVGPFDSPLVHAVEFLGSFLFSFNRGVKKAASASASAPPSAAKVKKD